MSGFSFLISSSTKGSLALKELTFQLIIFTI